MIRQTVISLAALLCLASSALADEAVTACYENKGWGNFVRGEDSTIPDAPGVLIELVSIAAEKQGIAIDMIRRPWKRCLLMLRENAAAFVIAGSYLPDRAIYAQYPLKADGAPDESRALHFANYYLFTRTGSLIRWDGKTLAGHDGPLGVDLGYSIAGILRKRGQAVQEFSDINAGFRLVVLGRLDGYVTFELDGQRAIKTHGFDLIQVFPPIESRAYYLMSSKGHYKAHKMQVERLWDAIPGLRKQLLPRLLDKYRHAPPA